jgi:hypothetical protein
VVVLVEAITGGGNSSILKVEVVPDSSTTDVVVVVTGEADSSILDVEVVPDLSTNRRGQFDNFRSRSTTRFVNNGCSSSSHRRG